MKNVFQRTRDAAEQVTGDAQARNRMWWESMPMTYAAWEAKDRLPRTRAEFESIERTLLAASPFLRERFDVAALCGLAVLDLGCGSGVLACRLAREGARVTAADLTDRGVRLAARNALAQGLDVRVVGADAERLGLADCAFDYVLSWGVLHHSPSTERALAEVARVLKPGARGLLMVYHRRSLVYYLKGLLWLVARGKLFSGYRLATVQDFYVDGYYHRHFTRNEMAACLAAAGLKPVRLFATQQQQKILPLVPGFLDAWLKHRFGWYLVAEFEKPAAAPSKRRLKLLVNGIHGRSGGGLTYLRNMLPHLAADPRLDLDLVLLAEQRDALGPLDSRIRVHTALPHGFWGRLVWEQIALPRLARKLGAEVTLSPANYGPILAPRPVIVVRNALAVGAIERREAKRMYWRALVLATTLSLLTCRRAVVASQYMRRALPLGLGRRLGSRIAVIPMGVDPRYTPGGGPADPPFVLAVGDIYVQKNYHRLIAAFVEVTMRVPEARLWIAGRAIDRDYLAELQNQVDALGLGTHVRFLGEQSPDALVGLFRAATVFVMPSSVESFGLSLVEAMACGAAVASSRAAAMPEVAGDAALFFDPDDPADIAEVLTRLLTDPALRRSLAAKALARACLFSWVDTARRLADVIESCRPARPASESALGEMT
ncbi:MAG: glycosyltransferase [Pseudomonadota bacterium]